MGHNHLNRRSNPVMEPIIIDSDYDSDSSGAIDNDPDTRYFLDVDAESSTAGSRGAAPALLSSLESGAEVVDLTEGRQSYFNEGDYLTDDCFQRLVSIWQEPAATTAPRTPSREPERRVVSEACMDGILYRPGQSVKLYDESYLHIKTVVEDGTGSVFLHGRRMIQTASHADRCIPKWQNELVWMANETSEVPLEIVKQSVTIIFTNWCKFEREQRYRSNLFCRLKETKKANATAVEYLSYDDADPNHRFHPRLLRQNWRGETRLFGEADDAGNGAIDLDDSPVIDLTDSSARRYTFGDGFCGAGGVSAGANQTGFNIKWAFDKSSHAATTYRLNFPTAMCEESDIFSFLTNDADFVRVDVSHGSPPCQTFSPAHTIECANDDANSACIFSCSDLIKKAKPRVHTVEETCGLFERHKEVFFRVIQDFIELGYSVRYGVLNCMDYGVPQSRRRLIIIASGPGEALPRFPKATHGLPDSGLREFETINSIISRISPGALDHDVQAALDRGLRNGVRLPFDPNQPARTVTCGGGDLNYHPSGRRGFTNREFACLQTFPMRYRFGPREIRKQIGNAVPPILAKAIYQEILKSLKKTDQKENEMAVGEIVIDD